MTSKGKQELINNICFKLNSLNDAVIHKVADYIENIESVSSMLILKGLPPFLLQEILYCKSESNYTVIYLKKIIKNIF